MYNFLETAIINNIVIAYFVVEMFTYDHIIYELLMRVPLITFETTIAGLLNSSVKVVYECEKDNIHNYCEKIYSDGGPNSFRLPENLSQTLNSYLDAKESDKHLSNQWVVYHGKNDAPLTATEIKKLKEIAKGSDLDEIEEEEEEEESEEEADDESGSVEYIVQGDKKIQEKLAGLQKDQLLIVEDSFTQENEQLAYRYTYNTKNDFQRVPVIIRLVNIIIHKLYEVDPKCSRNHNLLNVLCKVADLSSTMRGYFLVNSMVGRLLDQFYGDLCKFKNIFSDTSTIPIFKTNVECYISPMEHGTLLQDLDGTTNFNETRESASYSEVYYTFFYELVCNLVCSCKFKSLAAGNSDETVAKEQAQIADSQLDDSKAEESKTEEVKVSSRPQSASRKGMSPFFSQDDEPYQLTEEEQALLLLPTEQMFTKFFKT